MRIFCSETDPLALGSEWVEKRLKMNEQWSSNVTIKIFDDELKFEEYHNKMQEKNDSDY